MQTRCSARRVVASSSPLSHATTPLTAHRAAPRQHRGVRVGAAPVAPTANTIRVGSRDSKLARMQAEQVQLLLRRVRPEWGEEMFEAVTLKTHGDQATEGALRDLGQGAFTEVIDQAIVDGAIDIGVHSLKDAPVRLPDGVQLGACLPRDDPRDALISRKARTLAELPHGARVGTSSMRRKAQLLHAHPHLQVVPIRGNIDARLQMLDSGELDAIVLAAAGLSRLGQSSLITRVLDFDEMLPAACQGAIGVVCSADEAFLRWELGLLCHEPTRFEVAAERALLAALLTPPDADAAEDASTESASSSRSSSSSGASASPPTTAPSAKGISSVTGLPLLPGFAVAAHAGFDPHEGLLKLDGLVASEDGRTLHRLSVSEGAASPSEAAAIGLALGQQLRSFAVQHGWVEE